MQKSRKRTIYAAIILFILAVILYIIIRGIPSLTGALTGTEVVEYGDLQVSDGVTCYISRDETVYTANQAEKMDFFIKEGTQVKKGTKLLEAEKKEGKDKDSKYSDVVKDLKDSVAEDEDKHLSQRKGIFSFYVDGYEDLLNPNNIEKLKESDLKNVEESADSIKRKTAAKGEAIYKISNNASWNIIFWIGKDESEKYKEGNLVTAELGEESISCRVADVKKSGGDYRINLVSSRYYSGFSKDRVLEAKILTTDLKGIIVSNECIVTKDKVTGVYVKNTTGDYNFTPVEVLGTDGKKSVLTEGIYYDEDGKQVNTVNNYDEVRTHPKKGD